MISENHDINCIDRNGTTPLMDSINNERDDIIFLTVDLPKGKAKDKGEPDGESTESGN